MNKAQIKKTLNDRGADAANAYCRLPTFNKKFRLAPSSTFGQAFNRVMNNLYGVVPNSMTNLKSPVKKW